MSAGVITSRRPQSQNEPDKFSRLLHAEWTKYRTVRGWVVGVLIGGLLVVAINLLPGGECGTQNGNSVTTGGSACALTIGPGGEAVTDNFNFVHQQLTGKGTITVQVTSMTPAPVQGQTSVLQAWAKAGIIIKANTTGGSSYAAMMATGGHGVRMQWNYTQDIEGLADTVSATSPRWLRLTRAGDTITGYDSADGRNWVKVDTVTLAGLPSTVPVGVFATSPGTSSQTGSQSVSSSTGSSIATMVSATFAHLSLQGASASAGWTDTVIGAHPGSPPGANGTYSTSAQGFTVSGSGDIAPAIPSGGGGSGSIAETLTGTFAGLIAMIVVGTMFMTSEYRRGLIRVTLSAAPRRSRVLAAKAIVLGAVTFVIGLVATAVALVTGKHLKPANGSPIYPVSTMTEVRLIVGTAALLAVTAILAMALGTALRRSAAAITAVITLIVLPYFFANPLAVLPASAAEWLLRVTPAAGFAIQQGYPMYSQMSGNYTPACGYYPLSPLGGFAVLCAWTVLALGLAWYLLRRRDA